MGRGFEDKGSMEFSCLAQRFLVVTLAALTTSCPELGQSSDGNGPPTTPEDPTEPAPAEEFGHTVWSGTWNTRSGVEGAVYVAFGQQVADSGGDETRATIGALAKIERDGCVVEEAVVGEIIGGIVTLFVDGQIRLRVRRPLLHGPVNWGDFDALSGPCFPTDAATTIDGYLFLDELTGVGPAVELENTGWSGIWTSPFSAGGTIELEFTTQTQVGLGGELAEVTGSATLVDSFCSDTLSLVGSVRGREVRLTLDNGGVLAITFDTDGTAMGSIQTGTCFAGGGTLELSQTGLATTRGTTRLQVGEDGTTTVRHSAASYSD